MKTVLSNPLWKWFFLVFVARSLWSLAKATVEAVYTLLASELIFRSSVTTLYASADELLSLINGWLVAMSYLSVLAVWLFIWFGTASIIWFFYPADWRTRKLSAPKRDEG